jgi:alkylation response protein AidB-like acyl-CoA dehydrogenase
LSLPTNILVNPAVEDQSEAGHDADLWRQVGASGFLAAALPEQYSGAAAGCGPTVMPWASEAHERELLPRLAAGEDIAGIRTRAVKDGDDWIVNGQKIWISVARDADSGLLLTRTDPTVLKHCGLTMFIVDMESPGVEVRPIWQMNEESVFNEVYFTDVRIPDAWRLGDVGQGWTVVVTTLMNERVFGGSKRTGFQQLLGSVHHARYRKPARDRRSACALTAREIRGESEWAALFVISLALGIVARRGAGAGEFHR